MKKYKWAFIGLLVFGLVQAENIYTIKINSIDIINIDSFEKDFRIYLEKNLVNSGRISLGGYYKHVQDAEDIKIVNREVDIKFIRNSTNYEAIIKVVNLNNATVDFLLSVPFSYDEILHPMYCAQKISQKILTKIRVISIVTDRSGSEYVLDVGENVNIKRGDRFNVFDVTDTEMKNTIIAQLEVVAVQSEQCVAKIISQKENIDYGAICVLEMPELNNIKEDCTKIFIPAIIQSGKACSLFIDSNPSACEIYLNNCKYKDKTPTRINRLKPGTIKLSLYKVGYKKYQEDIQLLERSEIEKSVCLEPKDTYGILEINSDPAGAQIYLNEKNIGETPFVISSVRTGKFKLTVKKKGYTAKIIIDRIRENEKKKFSFVLKKAFFTPSAKNCEKITTRRYILDAIRQFKNKKSTQAMKYLKKAYLLDRHCSFIFYIKGLIEWIDLNQKKKAERSLNKAYQLGFQFNKETPYPANLDLARIIHLLNFLERRFQSKDVR